ncbi:MAG: class I SAM-dependent methyltransferase [Sumerlaeia bacterium]
MSPLRSTVEGLKKAVSKRLNKDVLSEGVVEDNLAWNKKRWGSESLWRGKDKFGYQWGGGHMQSYTGVVRIAENHLLPHLGERRDYDVVEIAPGAGRFTTELIRVAKTLALVDYTEACIKVCRERFQYYDHIAYHVNDGRSLSMLEDESADLVASFDALVHVVPEIIREYVIDIKRVLRPGGLAWLDHSGKGVRESGRRTAMTAEKMQEFAAELGLEVVAQHFRNDHDSISVLRKPEA